MLETSVPKPPQAQLGDGFDRFAEGLNERRGVVVATLTGLYLVLLIVPLQKILWHDELYTYYIAQEPTLEKFIYAIQHVDWQPPLIYVAVWLSHHVFGVSTWSTRLPSILAFYAGSMLIFTMLQRRIGALWAAIPVLLLWFSFYFKYATEARPYGLLFGFFGLSLLCYDRLSGPVIARERRRYLAGLFLGGAGMMLSHVLAPFTLLAFGIAEMYQVVRYRKIDVSIWLAIVAPLGIAVQSTGMVRSFETSYFPAQFQASIRKIFVWYAKALAYTLPGFAAAAALGWWTNGPARSKVVTGRQGFNARPQEFVLLFGLMLPPVLVNLVLMRSGGAFWERYCLTTALALYVVLGVGLARLLRFRKFAAFVVAVILTLSGLSQMASRYVPVPKDHPLDAIRPDLPMVASSGLAFLEMDHHENPALVKRLYYLNDREAAIRYAHATLFESGFDQLHRYFPLRASVEPYARFVREHKHFVVFGTEHYVEDWLFDKLAADGARVQEIQRVVTPYRDFTVYDVQFP